MKKKLKKPVVQLTSLLDLLFVMIFVLLLQSKATPTKADATPKPSPAPAPVAKVEKTKPKPRPTPEPAKPTKISIGAIFHFYATAKSPNVPTGIYSMQGTYNTKSGDLKLGGTNWIKRPQHYDMVPLSGSIDEKTGTFTGRIEFQDCKEFNLYKTQSDSGSPVAGKWEGTYTCGQGETGLTLTLR